MLSPAQKSKTIYLEVKSIRNYFFRQWFCVWHCWMNVYLFSSLVFGLNKTFHQNFCSLPVKTSFSMFFCKGMSFLKANFFSIAWGTLFSFEKCFLRKFKFWQHMFDRVWRSEIIFFMLTCEKKITNTLPVFWHRQTYFKLFQIKGFRSLLSCFSFISWVRGVTAIFALNLLTIDFRQVLFCSKQCANKTYLVSNGVFGLTQTLLVDVKSKLETCNYFLRVNLHTERLFGKDLILSFARTFTLFQIWFSGSDMFEVKNWKKFRDCSEPCSMWFCGKTTLS